MRSRLLMNNRGWVGSAVLLGTLLVTAGSLVAWKHAAARKADADRKSTRLNSSHLVISYAVFCLKKKNNDVSTLSWSHTNDILVPVRMRSCIGAVRCTSP